MRSNTGYGCCASADGLIMLGAYTGSLQRKLWDVLGEPARPVGSTLDEVARHASADRPFFAGRLATRTTAEWVALLGQAGVPASPVRNLDEALAEAQVLGRPSILVMEGGTLSAAPGLPFLLDGTVPSAVAAPPRHGADTRRILAAEGFTQADISGLKAAGAALQGRQE